MTPHLPERGDIITLNYEPSSGREIGKVRPALVLSPRAYNRQSGLVVVCAITTKVSDYPFEVRLTGKKAVGAVLADHVDSMDWRARRSTLIERASKEVLDEVVEKLGVLIAG